MNQAVATAIRLRGNTYWQTHSSDLTRAYRTAEIILEEHPGGKDSLNKTPLLREFGLGAQEGLPRGTTWCAKKLLLNLAGKRRATYLSFILRSFNVSGFCAFLFYASETKQQSHVDRLHPGGGVLFSSISRVLFCCVDTSFVSSVLLGFC